MKADIVIDLVRGDNAKGKVTHHLLKSGDYTHCIRYNGSQNAGHTIYHDNKKIITHLIPAGVFFNVPSIIGPGCALNVKGFFEEIKYLESNGINCQQIKIAENAHIITDQHLLEDSQENKIGTTRKGVGPCFRDKYARTGILAKEIPKLEKYLINFHDEIFSNENNTLLLEGAQGYYLDPIVGDYPYVTSSHCTVAGALLNGIPHTALRDIYGVCKAYDTYVGLKKFEPNEEIFKKIREVGSEFGATTGRPRQCNYLNLDSLIRAIQVTEPNHLIISKMDVLQQVGVWKVIYNKEILDLKNEENFIEKICSLFKKIDNINFSYSPYAI